MTLEDAIAKAELVARREEYNYKTYTQAKPRNDVDKANCEYGAKSCLKSAEEHRQLAEWLKILKSAKFDYNEAWLTITHPTPDVTYADKQRAQVILDKFRNSLGAMK